jgi:hypothetical protein
MARRSPFDDDEEVGQPAQVDPAVVSAVVTAYYSRFMSSGETARSRAQAAYAISSAAAGAVIIGLATDRPGDLGDAGTYAGMAALVAWLVAAALYLRAVAVPAQRVQPADYRNASDFVRAVAADARAERDHVDRRQRRANAAALVAAVLTVGTILVSTIGPGTADDLARGVVVLGGDDLAAVQAVCPGVDGSLPGLIRRSTLDAAFLEVVPAGGACTERRAVIRLPDDAVRAVRLTD